MVVINTTTSLKESVKEAIHVVESLIHADVDHVKEEVETGVKEEIAEVEKDVSPIIHRITITPLAVGHSIEVQFQHAAGETRRTVISGMITADSLVKKFRDLVK